MTRTLVTVVMLALALSQVAPATVYGQVIVVGNDEKVIFDDRGQPVFLAPGKDNVTFLDMSNREMPVVIGTLPLPNSLIGPPTNVAVTPDQRLALISNAVNWVRDGDKWKSEPDNKLHVVDLRARPPRHLGSIEVGKQPSGISINNAGDRALVACREDKSVVLLSIRGEAVTVLDSVSVGDPVVHVTFTPDGRRALAAKFLHHRVAVLEIANDKLTYAKPDMTVGQKPINIDITPDGKLALVANVGEVDGDVDTVRGIKGEASPPRVIDHVVVGDGPEGLAISPKGDIAVAVLLRGSALAPKNAWFYNRNGSVIVLKLDGKKVTRLAEVEVGGLPEGVVFSPDGGYLYVGNYLDKDLSILKVDGTTVTNTGKRLALPGHPASMRGRSR
jgi:DNA-binding beta-propeller fold protein YncE